LEGIALEKAERSESFAPAKLLRVADPRSAR
jgi:hypothetical protein